MTTQSDLEAKIAELLPCEFDHPEGCPSFGANKHMLKCAAKYRSAILALITDPDNQARLSIESPGTATIKLPADLAQAVEALKHSREDIHDSIAAVMHDKELIDRTATLFAPIQARNAELEPMYESMLAAERDLALDAVDEILKREIAGADEILKLDLTPAARHSADCWRNAAVGIQIAINKLRVRSIPIPVATDEQVRHPESLISPPVDKTVVIGQALSPSTAKEAEGG